MLYLLARIGMAIVGLVSGLMLGWLGAGWSIERFALEYEPSTAGYVLPLIGLGIVGGSNIGLIAGFKPLGNRVLQTRGAAMSRKRANSGTLLCCG